MELGRAEQGPGGSPAGEERVGGGRAWHTRIPSLVWEDPLEKEVTTHSSILAWKILWPEEPGRLQFMESHESDLTYHLNHQVPC